MMRRDELYEDYHRAGRRRTPERDPEREGGSALIVALVAGVVALPLMGLAVITWNMASDASDDLDYLREQVAVARAMAVGPAEVVRALGDERSTAALYVTGRSDVSALPVSIPDNATARQRADRAIASFQTELDQRDGELTEVYAVALDRTVELTSLRTTVDGVPDADRRPSNTDTATSVVDGYTGLMDAYVGAGERMAPMIDYPELRQGAVLAGLGARQATLTSDITRRLLAEALPDGRVEAEAITPLTIALSDLRAIDDLIATTATGDYRPLADALLTDERVMRFPQVVDEVIATATVDVEVVMASSPGLGDGVPSGYAQLEHGAMEVFDAQADELVSAATARRRQHALVAAVAVAATGAALLTMVVFPVVAFRADRRSRAYGGDGRR